MTSSNGSGAAAPIPPRKTTFITFYSFKGGVGRTMALLNAACILAGRGRRVLMVDFDLEAPGLSTVRDIKPDNREGGLIELIQELIDTPEQSPFASEDKTAWAEKYVAHLNIPEHVQKLNNGCLDLLPCGRLTEDYENRLYAINFADLYASGVGQPLFRHIKNVIHDSGQYDYVLIDSRTGVSDEGGISTRDLADHVVVVMSLNRQNVTGTVRFLQGLKKSGWAEGQVEFIFSPTPTAYEELRAERIKAAREAIAAVGYDATHALRIPYHARLALDEDPFIYPWSDTDIFPSWTRVQERLRHLAGDTVEQMLMRAREAAEKNDFATALNYYRRVSDEAPEIADGPVLSVINALLESPRGDVTVAEPFIELASHLPNIDELPLRFRLIDSLLRQGDFGRAQSQAQVALEIAVKREDTTGYRNALDSLRQVYESQKRLKEAVLVFQQASTMRRESGDRIREGQTLNNLGIIYQKQNLWKDAEAVLEQALHIARESKDREAEGKTLNNLGIVYRNQKRWKEAHKYYELSLNIRKDLSDRIGEGQTLVNLAVLMEAQDEITEAISFAHKAVAVLEHTQAMADRDDARETLKRLEAKIEKPRDSRKR